MVHSKSKPLRGGSLALALGALAGCNGQQSQQKGGEPTAPVYTAPQATHPATQQPGAGQPAGPAVQPPAGTPGAQAAPDPDLVMITVTGIDIDTRLAEMCKLPGTIRWALMNTTSSSA